MNHTPISSFAPTKRSMQAAALLGMDLDPGPRATRPPINDAARLLDSSARQIVLLGPSGAGKTTHLRAVAHLAKQRGVRVITLGLDPAREPSPAAAPLVDLFDPPVESAMRALARAGLAEGACFVRRPCELSTGQHFRLRLALALARVDALSGAPAALIIDEFASSLDEATAQSVAALLNRYIDAAPGLRLVMALPRRDILHAGRSALLVEIRQGAIIAARPATVSPPPRFRITRGSIRHYHALAPLHYRSGRPATIVRVLVARAAGGETAGVLVVSMPTLNGSWRARAWPGLFNSGEKRRNARRLNHPTRGVRCISRVLVDPRFRSVGLAARLVRAYLRAPMTTRTEAVAAMGRAATFFERAGMKPHCLARSPGDARLMDLLQQFGLRWWDLASPARAFRAAQRDIHPKLLERELERWTRSSRAARASSAARDPESQFRSACRRLASVPVAFTASTRA